MAVFNSFNSIDALMDTPLTPKLADVLDLPMKERIELLSSGGRKQTAPFISEKLPASQERINRSTSSTLRHQREQILVPQEETVLVDWILRLQAWGWPARVEQMRRMAQDLLTSRGSTHQLDVNWVQKFLSRHKNLRTIYTPPLVKECSLTQDPTILSH